MSGLVVICLVAGLIGFYAPRWWQTRPVLAVSLASFVPVAVLYWRYTTYVRPDDWEGMAALAFIIAGVVWIVTTLAAGMFSMICARVNRGA